MTRKYVKRAQPSGGERPEPILEGHDLEEDSSIQANLEKVC